MIHTSSFQQAIANRTQKVLRISLDDVEKVLAVLPMTTRGYAVQANPALAQAIQQNTKRYSEMFALAAEEIGKLPEEGTEVCMAMDLHTISVSRV